MKIRKNDLHFVAQNQYVQTKFRSIIQKRLCKFYHQLYSYLVNEELCSVYSLFLGSFSYLISIVPAIVGKICPCVYWTIITKPDVAHLL